MSSAANTMFTTTVTTTGDKSQALSFKLNSRSSHVNDVDNLYKIYTLIFGKIKLTDVALRHNTPRLELLILFLQWDFDKENDVP